MQTRFDQAMKQMLRMLLEPCGTFTSAMEVSPDPQEAEGYFVPDPSKSSQIADTLLGRMTSTRCAFEMFSTTPSIVDVSACVRKHLNMRHVLSVKGPDEPLPHQWIVSAGFPKEAMRASRAHQIAHWPKGVVGLPPMFATSIIVVSKLPETPSTLLLRLMGRGQTLRRAVAELRALPADEFQRCATLPILLRYRIDTSPVPVLSEEKEYLVNTQEMIDYVNRKYIEETVKKEVKQKLDQAMQQGLQHERELAERRQLERERALIMRQLTRRFGEVPSHIAQCIESANTEMLDRYADKLVVVSSVEDVIADK